MEASGRVSGGQSDHHHQISTCPASFCQNSGGGDRAKLLPRLGVSIETTIPLTCPFQFRTAPSLDTPLGGGGVDLPDRTAFNPSTELYLSEQVEGRNGSRLRFSCTVLIQRHQDEGEVWDKIVISLPIVTSFGWSQKCIRTEPMENATEIQTSTLISRRDYLVIEIVV